MSVSNDSPALFDLEPIIVLDAGSKARVVEVALNRLCFDEGQPRQTIDATELDLLASSLAAVGRTMQLITVRRGMKGTWVVVSGERRVRAARKLGWKSLPAVVDEGIDDPTERLVAQVAENTARAPLSPAELGAAVARLRDQGRSANEIAAGTGLSIRTVYNYLGVLEHPDLVSALADGASLRAVLRLVGRKEPANDSPVDQVSEATSVEPAEQPDASADADALRAVDALVATWPTLSAATRHIACQQLTPLLRPGTL